MLYSFSAIFAFRHVGRYTYGENKYGIICPNATHGKKRCISRSKKMKNSQKYLNKASIAEKQIGGKPTFFDQK